MKTGTILLGLGISILAGCSGPEPQVLTVGAIYPLSGSLPTLAENAVGGETLALSDLERSGGLRIGETRYAVRVVRRDGGETPEQAVAAATDLINRENVAVIVGPALSAQAIPVARLATRTGVPMVTQQATHPDVTRGTRNVWRVCFVDAFQGAVLARFALEGLGSTRGAILYDKTNPFPTSLAEVFRTAYQQGGGMVEAVETFATGEVDFLSSLRVIRDSGAQVLLLPNYREDLVRIGAQIREMGLDLTILGGDAMRFTTPEEGRLYDGAFMTAHFAPDNPTPVARGFVERYRAANGKDPTDAAALTYDAINMVLEAARRAKGVGALAIARGLSDLREYRGVTGTMLFDGAPEPRKSVVIALIRDGKPVFYRQVDP